MTESVLVERYLRMWPRAALDLRDKGDLVDEVCNRLNGVGVYVLYRDDQPYYVGKSKNVWGRIHDHANTSYGQNMFWNYFSVFFVKKEKYLNEVESILIASMPQIVNRANPRLEEERLGKKIIDRLRDIRLAEIKFWEEQAKK